MTAKPPTGLLIVAAAALLVCQPAPADARPGRPAEVRIGVVVGNNVGNDPTRPLRYAETEVGRIASLLRAQGDFSSVEIVRGGGRQEVERALADARTRLAKERAAGRPTLFMFYYSGHGDKDALELGTSRLPFRDLRTYLEALPADMRLAFVDACQSGALTGVKGGKRAPGYQVQLADPGHVKGMAIVTSSTANELSQESDDLRGSYFTSNIMVGLHGAADFSGDDQVTLDELYHYTFRRTLANTAASLVGGQHPAFVFNLHGAGDVVLTRRHARDARLRFPREAGITYVVMRQQKKGDPHNVIGEVVSSAGEDLYLALPAGEYTVLRRALASVTETQVSLAPGAEVKVEPAAMLAVLTESTKRKKGDAGEALDVEVAGTTGSSRSDGFVEVMVGAQTTVLPGASGVTPALGLGYTRAAGPWALRARGEVSTFEARVGDYDSRALRFGAALDVLWTLAASDAFVLRLGPTVGLPVLRQRDVVDGASRTSYGVVYGGAAVAAVRVTDAGWLSLSAFGGAETFKLDGHRATRRAASVAVGGGLAF